MGKFSDSPFFLLKYFFDTVLGYLPPEIEVPTYDWLVDFYSSFTDDYGVTSISSETNGIGNSLQGNVFTDNNANVWNMNLDHLGTLPNTINSYLVGPLHSIVTKGGRLVTLYIKEKDRGFTPLSLRPTYRDGNVFNFSNVGPFDWIPGDTITQSISGEHYEFYEYNKRSKTLTELVTNSSETFFRKDSTYHEWVKESSKGIFDALWEQNLNMRNYLNTDTLFSYFGQLYFSSENDVMVEFYGMKDYVMDAIPEHQRTTNLKEMFEIFFDRAYQENYNLLKNIFTLIDPYEIDFKYIGYLSKYFRMFDIYDLVDDELAIREFIKSMPYVLKRKGTHTEQLIIWKVITGTRNRLNMYEKWHDSSLSGSIPTSAWNEYNYLSKPEYGNTAPSGDESNGYILPEDGAGIVWYDTGYPTDIQNYDTCGEIITPHFRTELDLNLESANNEEIFPEYIWERLYKYWNYLKPVNRVDDYRIMVSPKCTFSGENMKLFDDISNPSNLWSKSLVPFGLTEVGAYIHYTMNTSSSGWLVEHDLNMQYVLVQTVDHNLNEIMPTNIEFIDDSSLYITFSEPVSGMALCKIPDVELVRHVASDNDWRLYHYQGSGNTPDTMAVNIQFSQSDDKYYTGHTELRDGGFADTIYETIPLKAMITKSDEVFVQSTPSTVWEFDHEPYKRGWIISVYTSDNMLMHPSTYTLDAHDMCSITFDEPTEGYVSLLKIGNANLESLWDDVIYIIEQGMTWRIASSIGDLESNIVVEQGNVNNMYWDDDCFYFDIEIPHGLKYNIREIDLIDHKGRRTFYSVCNNIWKPDYIDFTIHYRAYKRLTNY